MQGPDRYSLMLHGGAGALDNVHDDRVAVRYLESIRCILEHGREVLSGGGSALQAVEVCASMLEDDPIFNAGCGSVLNENGYVEMDAAIMDGRNLRAGAVAGVDGIANPVQLARRVMTDSEHVMLVADGAMRFADVCGVERVPASYFYTEDRLAQLKQAQLRQRMMLDHDDMGDDTGDHKYGTVGAVARDLQGNLAAATSTGGIVNKRQGRVGDSPIIGAGLYADNQTCAVSSTGYGEEFMRSVIAKTIADYVDMCRMDARAATEAGIEYLKRKVNGRGGVIVVDFAGNCALGHTTPKLIHGWIEHGGRAQVGFHG